MGDDVKFPKNAICVNGSHVAAEMPGGATVIQDDDGDLWAVVGIKDIVVVLNDEYDLLDNDDD